MFLIKKNLIVGTYCLYNDWFKHSYVRDANAIASTPLYLIMGLFWRWDGSLKDLRVQVLSVLRKR